MYVAAVIENVPSKLNHSVYLKEAAQKLLGKIMQSEDEMASFDEFSESVVSYL